MKRELDSQSSAAKRACHHELHPLRVKPLGNVYISVVSREIGRFSAWSDELLLHLLSFLPVPAMLALGACNRTLYALACHDDQWRERSLPLVDKGWTFMGTWRESVLRCTRATVDCSQVYSDALYRPWQCATFPLALLLDYMKDYRAVDKRHGLTIAEFRDEYESRNHPVVLTDVVKRWPAYASWDMAHLLQRYGQCSFRAEACVLSLEQYDHYAQQTVEESPLYLFDKDFCTTCPDMANDYSVPAYFDDLFSVLGHERPDYRWLIIGPERSGSTFHKDPNGTSAWNALVRGRKLWIFYPPDACPPGVFVDANEEQVTSPVSLMEWMLTYCHDPTGQAYMTICEEGELVFVPSGWWHCVLNLTHCIAITQNYVSERNLKRVLAFLRDKPDQVSGCRGNEAGLLERFQSKLDPALVARATQKHVTAWEALTQDSHKETTFSFGFC
jgi:hypothetical protein